MIEVSHLTKRFGKLTAVNDLSFNVNEGEILGLLGPNGAGKSTTMNMLTGYLSSTEGSIKINGVDILTDPIQAKKKIGYLPELPPNYNEMTVKEYLTFVCHLKGVHSHIPEHIQEICQLVKIDHVSHRLIKNLSKGYRQRVGFAQALINAPDLLVLDEPTVGLDPKEIIEIRNLIKFIGRKRTIIISSHILSEVQAVCDRILVINKGNLIAYDTPQNLSKKLAHKNKLYFRILGNENEIFDVLSSVEGVDKVTKLGQKEPGSFDFNIEGDEELDLRVPIFNALCENKMPVLITKGSEISLEDIFLQLTSESIPSQEVM